MGIALVVPVMSNFKGFTQLIQSVSAPVYPFIHNNWDINVGVSRAWNVQIVRALSAGYDEIIVANDDTILEPNTIYKMLEGLKKGYDLVTPVNTRDAQKTEDEVYIPNPDFAMFAINRNTVQKFGLFDERIHSYFNDNDYSWRIKAGGGQYAARVDAGFYHVGSVTQNMGGDGNNQPRVVSHDKFREAQNYYTAKWGGGVGNEVYPTPFNDPNKTIKDW